jgi:hypothetical protein
MASSEPSATVPSFIKSQQKTSDEGATAEKAPTLTPTLVTRAMP